MTHIQSLGNTIYIVVQGIEIQTVDVTDPASPSLVYRYLTDARFIQATSDSIRQLAILLLEIAEYRFSIPNKSLLSYSPPSTSLQRTAAR